MKKYMAVFLCMTLLLTMSGCSKNGKSKYDSVADIIQTMRDAKIPIIYDIVYTDQNDPNGDNEHAYIQKGNFADSRIEKEYDENQPLSGSVEKFETKEKAIERADYLKSFGTLDDFGNNLIVDNYLIRLSKYYSEDEKKEIAKIFDVEYYSTVATSEKEKEKTSTPEVEEKKEIANYIIYDYFFDNDLRWNMAYEEGKDTIKFATQDTMHSFNPESNKLGALAYYGHSKLNFPESYVFIFPQGNLKAYWVDFDNKNSYKDYISLYYEIKQLIIDKYGEPATEDFHWTDTAYKDNESEWNKALKYGYLEIESEWTYLDNMDIVIRFSKDSGYKLIICEKGYIPYL